MRFHKTNKSPTDAAERLQRRYHKFYSVGQKFCSGVDFMQTLTLDYWEYCEIKAGGDFHPEEYVYISWR